ncbi:hypothetical protein BBP40_000153 [Aspergillus hancockii]|nr:hypothetical protein BBP40_000153 [Aspergillus hancockii]
MAIVAPIGTLLHQGFPHFSLCGPPESPTTLKLGVLSTPEIGDIATFHFAKTHPDVVLYAIASRDAEAAAREANLYRFTKSCGSFQGLLDDPAVDVVYILTPIGQHYEWASRALQAGKHVLCEKPFTSNAEEAKALVSKARERNSTLEEAFHWQFHHAAHTWRHILESGQHGRILRTKAVMTSCLGVIRGILDGDMT